MTKKVIIEIESDYENEEDWVNSSLYHMVYGHPNWINQSFEKDFSIDKPFKVNILVE